MMMKKKLESFIKSSIINFNNFEKIHKLLNVTNLIIAIPSLNYDLRKKLLTKFLIFQKIFLYFIKNNK